MHKMILHNVRKSIRFRFWSRKNYAVFGSLHRHVTIGRVCKGIADSALDKAKIDSPSKDTKGSHQYKAVDDDVSGYRASDLWKEYEFSPYVLLICNHMERRTTNSKGDYFFICHSQMRSGEAGGIYSYGYRTGRFATLCFLYILL